MGAECGLACQTKIILDGDNISSQGIFIASLAENLCQRIEAAELPIKDGFKIAGIFADIEDKLADITKQLYHAQRIFIDGTGYSGPLPKVMS